MEFFMKNKSLLFIALLSCSSITLASCWDYWNNDVDDRIMPVLVNRHDNRRMYDSYSIQTPDDIYHVEKIGNKTTARGLLGNTISYKETALGYEIADW